MLSNTSRTKYKLFRHGLPQTPRRSFGGQQQQKLLLRKGTTSQYSKKRYNNGNQNSYGYGYGKYKPGNLVQQSAISLCSSSGGSKTHTSLHKKLILCKKNSKCTVSRKVEKLYRELENSDKRHRNSVVSRGLYNTISRNSSAEKHPKLSQIKSGRKEGNSRYVEQGSPCRDLKPLERGIYQQPFSRREKGWAKPTSDKFETPKSVHTLPALQDGGFALSSKYSEEGRLHVQTGFEACVPFSSIKSCIQKICAVSLVRETLWVSLHLFWTRPSTKNFYKISQNSSFSVTSPEHTWTTLLIGHTIDQTLMARDRVIFLLQQQGFVLNLKKSVLTPTQRKE